MANNKNILKIDLSNRTCSMEEIPKEILKKYIGGRGLGSYLLYNSVPEKTDPLGQDNHLIITAGPASGTDLFYSSKVCLNTKSPLTNAYLYSICSGILPHQMKKAGLWAIDIKGIASSPIYLVINNHQVEFRDATPLWGMETARAQEMMLGGQPRNSAASVAIGPAGEQLVRYASVFGEGPLYRCFGRGGGGCVMGSKNLKGLTVTGTGEVEITDKAKLDTIKKGMVEKLKTDCKKWADMWRRYETAADLQITNDAGILPTRNWQNGQFEGWRGIDKSTTPMGWPENNRPCGPFCLTPGCREVVVEHDLYKGARSDIEWETIYALGSTCGVDKMEAVLAASQLCDEFGMDTMTSGVTIGFAMECFEKGLIGLKDTDGIELRFGNDQAMIAMLQKIAKSEGFGKRLAMGTKKLSEQIHGSETFAMHVKGMELGGYECRGINGQALQFAISTRGGCHHAYGLPARSEISDGSRLNVQGKGESVKHAAIGRIVRDSMIICTFLTQGPPSMQVISDGLLAGVLSSVDNEPWSVDELKQAGVRIMCQERLFNMREGLTRQDDSLPDRLLKEPKPDGPTKGVVVPLEELKDDFYRAMGYDLATGNPPDSLLNQLGITK
ncbi:aldehyde ferredoxin oxidoreductase family protein [Chloroflexota bacterium]